MRNKFMYEQLHDKFRHEVLCFWLCGVTRIAISAGDEKRNVKTNCWDILEIIVH